MNRKGLAIGIISRGTVPLKWMKHMYNVVKNIPGGTYWDFITCEGKSWAEARKEVVRKARERNFQWLLFVDDDVFVPYNVVGALMSRKKDIITGVYWTKTQVPSPVMFKEMGTGPMWDFPLDSLFEIDGAGLGCCLINMDVFDKFDELGLEHFKENWIHEKKVGNRIEKIKCPIGEDHYFFIHAKEKCGYKVWCDSTILCDHYDINRKIMFPGEKKVRELSKQRLKELGKEDMIKEQESVMGKDPNKKTIVFMNASKAEFCGDEIERRGIGGSEGDIIYLAKEFYKLKYNVHVYCNCPRPGVYDGVVYKMISGEAYKEISELKADTIIVSRNVKLANGENFKKEMNARQIILWTHDMPNSPAYEKFEEYYKQYDYIVALTNYHKEEILKAFPFIEESKTLVFRNGIDPELFNTKDIPIESALYISKPNLIYSSTPFRGLDILLEVFPEIKKEVPEVTLDIYSSMKTYGNNFDDSAFQKLYKKAKEMEGVTYHGSVKKRELAQAMKKATLLAYPNTYLETCCNTIMEAISCGTPIVSTKQGAITEITPQKCRVLVSGKPNSKEYKELFVKATVSLLKDYNLYRGKADACKKYDFSWKAISKEWEILFSENKELGSTKILDNNKNEEVIPNGNVNTPEYWDSIYKMEYANMEFREDKERFHLVCQYIKDGDKVLDIGCGTGAFTRFLKNHRPKCEVWGSDISMYALDVCRQMDKRIFYANHPIANDKFEEQYFKVITIQHVLEHVEDPKKMMDLAIKLLNPFGGKIIVALPWKDKPWHEHLTIWDEEKTITFFKQFNIPFTIQFRKDYQGHGIDEIIIVMEKEAY